MTDPKPVSKWMGTPITDLSKEELIDALELVGRLYNEALKQRMKDLDTLSALYKRGIDRD